MIAVLFAVALAADTTAVAEAPPPVTITSPQWLYRPSGENFAQAFPPRAFSEGVGGRGVVVCKVNAQGYLRACEIESETPAGYGFGKAVLKMTRYFRMAPTTADGQSVDGGTVRLPLVWRLPPRS